MMIDRKIDVDVKVVLINTWRLRPPHTAGYSAPSAQAAVRSTEGGRPHTVASRGADRTAPHGHQPTLPTRPTRPHRMAD
jgi:hypothetical protein